MSNINDLEKIFSAENEDPNDEYYQQILKLKKNDPEFFKAIENYYKTTTIRSSKNLKNMALEEARAYKKRLAIEEKINRNRLNWFMPFSSISLRVAISSGLFIIVIGITYYQYTKQSSPTNIVTNRETPAIKLSPSSTPTPVVTPNPVETISPNIAKTPEKNINNDKVLTKLNEKKNNKDLTAKYQQNRNKRNTQIQPNKSMPENNSIDNKDNEQEDTAITQVQPNKSMPENNSIDNKDNEREDTTIVTRGNNSALATIKNIYISNFIEKDLRNALKEVLKANGFNVFENLANPNTSIDGQLEYSLPETNSVILSINNKIVFEKFLTRSFAKEEAQAIVSSLIEAIEKAKEVMEKSKTQQKQK